MHPIRRMTRLAFRSHLPRRTVRLRLALFYGGLFLVSGAGLLAITNYLVRRATAGTFSFRGKNGQTLSISVGGSVPGAVPVKGVPGTSGGGGGSGPALKHITSGQFGGSSQHALRVLGGPSSGLTAEQAQQQAHQLQSLAIQQHNSLLHQLLIGSWIALAIMTVLSVALGWLVAGRVLRPLRTITTAARDISVQNLHERLTLDRPDDELKELGDTFDGLLGRLEASFNAQRRFVANASHELRTPLARQRAVVQVALSDPQATAHTLRRAHERVLASGEQQERLIEALLTLSRAQTGVDTRVPLNLATVTGQVLASKRSEAQVRGLHLETTLGSAPICGDARLVERLVINLVDNAIRHNVPGGNVSITTGTREGNEDNACLVVSNDGPRVPESEIARLLQPFQRLGGERTGHHDGLGVGLSIVEAVAEVHDAILTTRARSEGGLSVEVEFPRPPADLSMTPLAFCD